MLSFTQKSFLVLFLLIFGVGAVNGQEDNMTVSLYYDFEGTADYSINDLDNVIETVNDILIDMNIEIITEQGADYQYRDQDAIFLTASSGFSQDNEVTILTLTSRNFDIERQSSILVSDYHLDYLASDSIENILVGLAFYNVSLFDNAQLILEQELTQTEKQRLNFYLGNISLMQEAYATALEYFNQTDILSFEDISSIAVNTAWTLFKLDSPDDALATIDATLQTYTNMPTYTGLQLSIATASLQALMLDYDSAINSINVAIGLAEENDYDERLLAELYTIRGEIIFLIYEWDRVEDNFDTAIELDPTYSPAYFQRGVLFYTMARREDALADFETYLDLAPNGIYAEQALSYIDSIEIELEALSG